MSARRCRYAGPPARGPDKGHVKTAETKEIAPAVARGVVGAARALLTGVTLGFTTLGTAQERGPVAASREDIYVLHSLREERIVESSWCTSGRTGFVPLGEALEERFGLWSVQAEPGTGRVADAKTSKVGEIRTCSAETLDPRVVNFYAEGKLGELPFTGNGDCRLVQADYPERGIAALRCYLELRGLPSEYQGGLATSNTLVSGAVLGGETDPPGYLQTSIATFRLWKVLLNPRAKMADRPRMTASGRLGGPGREGGTQADLGLSGRVGRDQDLLDLGR